MIPLWIATILISAIIPILLSVYSAEIYPLLELTRDEWSEIISATLPLWFSLIVLAIQQISDQRRDNRQYNQALQEKYDAETSTYNGAFLHLSNSTHQKLRHLAQALSQIETLSEHQPMEYIFNEWRKKLKEQGMPSNDNAIRNLLREKIETPELIMSKDGKISSAGILLSNCTIPDISKASLLPDEEILISHLANTLEDYSREKHIILFAVESLTNGFTSDIALNKFNREISELAKRIYEDRPAHEIKDAIYGVIIQLMFLVESLSIEVAIQIEALTKISKTFNKNHIPLKKRHTTLRKPLELVSLEIPPYISSYLSLEIALISTGLSSLITSDGLCN